MIPSEADLRAEIRTAAETADGTEGVVMTLRVPWIAALRRLVDDLDATRADLARAREETAAWREVALAVVRRDGLP